MRLFLTLTFCMMICSSMAQKNNAFQIALAEEIGQLIESDELIVNYNKSGDWGSYEGGVMTFKAKGDEIQVTLSNAQNHSDKKHESNSVYPRSVLIDRLLNYAPPPINTDDLVINNYINYIIQLNGEQIGTYFSQLTPEEVINRVQLNPNLSDFFKKAKSRKGVLINN